MDYGNILMQLLNASQYTIGLFFMTLIIALPLGMLIYFMSISKFKPLAWITNVFIWIIRGTPLMLQIIIIYYGPGLLGGTPIGSNFWAATVAFGVNYAAYFAVIYKGGFQAVPYGQNEATRVLGLNKWQSMARVVFPQACKRIVQPMSNEVITLVKDTSLANVIAVAEIIAIGKNLSTVTTSIVPLLFTAIFYLAFVGILTLLFRFIEKKFEYYKG